MPAPNKVVPCWGHQQQCQSSLGQACGDPHVLLLTQLTADRHTPHLACRGQSTAKLGFPWPSM